MAKLSETKAKVDKPPTTEFRPLEGFVTLYVNSANLEASAWDLKIRLGRITQVSKERIEIGELAHVYMSPQHAKAFLKALESTVAKYESVFGPIQEVKQTVD